MNILFSINYSLSLNIKSQTLGEHALVAVPRASDWGKKGFRKYLHHVVEAVRVMWQARRFDALVLCTVGIEAFIVARWHKILSPYTRIIIADLLMPQESRFVGLVRPWLRNADAFVCIRRGDIDTLQRRFGVPREKCRFAPFPIDPTLHPSLAEDGAYIYSAGAAHRDWPTLLNALAALPYRALLSPATPLKPPKGANGRIEVMPMQSPEEGRKLMARAGVVVLSLEDTDLPSGPLVLLDAMALGKAVVATNVNGTRDYITDGETALLTPPSDSRAMAAAIDLLMKNPERRNRMGQLAYADVRSRFTLEQFIRQIVEICGELK